MAETDVFYEFRREPGFSSSVYSPDSSRMLHMHILKDLVFHLTGVLKKKVWKSY